MSAQVDFSRRLRVEMTYAEAALWELLRNRKLGGYKFRRQQIIEGFIVDFFCEKAKLVVVVDGGRHHNEDQKKIDMDRRALFESRGLVEIRFSNEQIAEDSHSVLQKILDIIKARIGSQIH